MATNKVTCEGLCHWLWLCVCVWVCVHKEPLRNKLTLIAPICAAASLANGPSLSLVLMPHASVTSTGPQNDPSCYCVPGRPRNIERWVQKRGHFKWPPATMSTAGSGTKAQHLLPLSRAKTETDFFVPVQFSISLAMGRDAAKLHSIITLFHRQKHRKQDLFQ